MRAKEIVKEFLKLTLVFKIRTILRKGHLFLIGVKPSTHVGEWPPQHQIDDWVCLSINSGKEVIQMLMRLAQEPVVCRVTDLKF